MTNYGAGLVNLVDARIAAHKAKTRDVGTFVTMDSGYAMVAFDGSSLALPCKYVAGLALVPDTRVLVELYGSDWVVTGQLSKVWPVHTFDFTTFVNFTNTTASLGSPVVEVQFDAPPSGGVYITVGGHISQGNVGNRTVLTYRLVQGTTYDTGSQVQGFDQRRAIIAGNAVTAGGGPEAAGTFRFPVSNLEPGEHYVARVGHYTEPAGQGTVTARFLMAEPVTSL